MLTGEVQARLICVGKYRVYSIKKTKLVGKHSIAREVSFVVVFIRCLVLFYFSLLFFQFDFQPQGHMFDINLVESASPDEVVIHFERDAVCF